MVTGTQSHGWWIEGGESSITGFQRLDGTATPMGVLDRWGSTTKPPNLGSGPSTLNPRSVLYRSNHALPTAGALFFAATILAMIDSRNFCELHPERLAWNLMAWTRLKSL